MINDIQHYLQTRPFRYDFNAYDAFLREVPALALPNAIHITGTNGKGSTARYLAGILQAAGFRVGLFVSPHFQKFNELASINDQPISDDYIRAQITKFANLFDKYALSSFEIMTFISFHYFVDERVDFTIVEVGMGGAKDATNIFEPILSVITNVGLDHKKELGPTLLDIAKHKAGIIKRGVPAIIGRVNPEVQSFMKGAAQALNAPLYVAKLDAEIIKQSVYAISFKYDGMELSLASGAAYEVLNAALVWDIVRILKGLGYKINVKDYKKALLTPPYPGRFSVVASKPLVIVDGAHNTHALRALFNDVLTLKRKIYVVYATFSDKDYEKSLDLLTLANADVVLTSFDHPRARTEFSVDHGYPLILEHEIAIKQMLKKVKTNELLLIIGSLYFATLVTREFAAGKYAI